MQWAQVNMHNHIRIHEQTTDWPEGTDFGASLQDVTHAEEAPPYNELAEDERVHVLLTDGSCHIVQNNRKWKASVWSPTW